MNRPGSKTLGTIIAIVGLLVIVLVAMGNVQYDQGKDIATNAGEIKTIKEVSKKNDEKIQLQLSHLKDGQKEIKEMISKIKKMN